MEDEQTAQSNALDVNSSAFDCSSFVSDVLARRSLPELMTYQNQLVGETRSLDRDMQELVYNNYNKFISATDTIRKMKDSVGEMESAMKRLVTDMRTMGGNSALVNDNLQENRGKIEKFVGVKRLLLKLEFLFELPMRLRRSMELDALAQAVRYYTMVSEVLHKYDRIPSIHAIRVEADSIMDKLKEQLRSVLKQKKDGLGVSTVSSGKVVEAIRLLVQLGEPRAGLRAAYLQFQRGRLLASLNGFAARHAPAGGWPSTGPASASAASSGAGSTLPEASSLISDRAKQFYAQAAAAKAAAAVPSGSIAPSRPRSTIGAHAFVQGCNRSFLDGFRYGAELYVELFEEGIEAAGANKGAGAGVVDPEQERRLAHDELLAFTKDVFSEYFTAIKRQLSLPPALDEDLNAEESAKDAKKGGKGKSRRNLTSDDGPQSPGPRVSNEEADQDEVQANELKQAALAAAGYVASKDESAAGKYAQISSALQLLLQDARGASKHVREAQLLDRAHETTEAVLRAQLDGLFADVRGHVVRLLLDLQSKCAAIVEDERRKATEAAGTAASSSESGEQQLSTPKHIDWVVAVGASLARAGEEASNTVSARVDEALLEAKPLVLSGMRLLPDLARVFSSLVHGQVLSLLGWLAAVWEACGDGAHPCRVEFNKIAVEADLGLDKELELSHGRKKTSSSQRLAAAASKASVHRRATVNFAHPEADQSAPVVQSSLPFSTILSPEGDQQDKHHCFLLLLAVVCKHYAHNGVARALSTMITTLPSRSDLHAMGIVTADDEEEVESFGSMTDVPNIIRQVQSAGRELLRRFVFLHGSRLTMVVRKAMTAGDWTAHREPREVRLLVQLLLEDVAAEKKLVAATLGEWDFNSAIQLAGSLGIGPEAGSVPGASASAAPALRGAAVGTSPATVAAAAAGKRTSTVVCAAGLAGAGPSAGPMSVAMLGLGPGSGPSGRGLPMDIERIFKGNGADTQLMTKNILGAADYNADSVASLLLRVVFKSLCEWTRACTFSTGGYQQLQCDLAALHLALPYFTSSQPPPAAVAPGHGSSSGSGSSGASSYDAYAGAGILEELLHETAVSGGERCVDPVAIQPSVMYEIATQHLATLNLPAASL